MLESIMRCSSTASPSPSGGEGRWVRPPRGARRTVSSVAERRGEWNPDVVGSTPTRSSAYLLPHSTADPHARQTLAGELELASGLPFNPFNR